VSEPNLTLLVNLAWNLVLLISLTWVQECKENSNVSIHDSSNSALMQVYGRPISVRFQQFFQLWNGIIGIL